MTTARELLREARSLAEALNNAFGKHHDTISLIQRIDAFLAQPESGMVPSDTPETESEISKHRNLTFKEAWARWIDGDISIEVILYHALKAKEAAERKGPTAEEVREACAKVAEGTRQFETGGRWIAIAIRSLDLSKLGGEG